MLPVLENTSQSALGTKKYWDEYYSREIINFEETGDKGEIWFGKQSERKILKFITENVDDVAGAKIVELGMGNASLLRKLRENGYRNLHGIDYSPNALELARRACDAKTNSDARIHFHLIDLTAANAVEAAGLHDRFDCIVDKGTWDAISLTSGDKAMCLRNYRDAVIELARTHSSSEKLSPFFIIVSCNFTRKELEEMFECEKIVFYKELPSATTVTFSGRTGSTFTGEVFRIQKQ